MDVFQVVKALRVQKPGAVHTVVSLASQHAVSSVCVLYIINPRRVCAARVTVVVLCVRMYLCVYVCMCVHSYLPPHTLESQKRDTNQCFFQDLGQGGAKRQYVIWWGGMALSTCTALPVPRRGARVSLGGANAPPRPPLKETLPMDSAQYRDRFKFCFKFCRFP